MSRCGAPSMRSYSPAATAKRYGGRGGVVAKLHVVRPPALREVLERAVGAHRPSVGHLHLHRQRRLEAGLVEAGEHPMGVEGLEVGVGVHGAVDGVAKAVQPDAAAVVGAVRCDHEVVVALTQTGQAQTATVEGVLVFGQLAGVEHDTADARCGEVDEGVGTVPAATEIDDGLRGERRRRLIVSEGQQHLVTDVAEQLRPLVLLDSELVVVGGDHGCIVSSAEADLWRHIARGDVPCEP